MTLVAGQKFFQGLTMIADSRATWSKTSGGIYAKADIAQKLFYFPEHCFISFAGDFLFASEIISFLFHQGQKNKKLQNIDALYLKAPKLIEYAYRQLEKKYQKSPGVAFVIGGVPLQRPPVSYKNQDGSFGGYLGNLFRVQLFSYRCPEFQLRVADHNNPVLAEGSGSVVSGKIETCLKGLQFGGRMDQRIDFQAVIMENVFKDEIKKQGIDTVGGLYQIAVIDRFGSRFIPYQGKRESHGLGGLDVELIIQEDGRFLQRDLITGKTIPLLYPPEVVGIPNPAEELFADL
jgi:hypothetical protein